MGLFNIFKNNKNDDRPLNIEQTKTIDAIAVEENGTKLIMLLSDGMDWHDEARHLGLLQDKLNTYAYYIESKKYAEQYPNVEKFEIQMHFLFKETENFKMFLAGAIKQLADNIPNLSFKIELGTEDTYKK